MAVYRLRLCGGVEIRDPEGRVLDPLMRQPKRLMLLAHLALSEGHAQRDSLAALFWPESDDERARHALRQSLYFLRSHLGDGLVVSKGTEHVRVNFDRLWCDVPAVEAALLDGRWREAHGLYRGDLLAGVYARDVSEELEQIIDIRRARLKERMAEAAWTLADAAADAGDALEVHHWGRRAVELSREVESAYRRLIVLLDRVGDAGAAVAVHDDLVDRLESDLGVAPSPETTRLVQSLRDPSRARWTPPRRPHGPSVDLPHPPKLPSVRIARPRLTVPDVPRSLVYARVVGIGVSLVAVAFALMKILSV